MDHRKVVWVPVKEVFWWVGWNEFITEGEKPENHKACQTFGLFLHNNQVGILVVSGFALFHICPIFCPHFLPLPLPSTKKEGKGKGKK